MNKRGKQTAKRYTRTERQERKTASKSPIVFLEDEKMYQVKCAGRVNKYGIGSHVPEGSCAYKEERGEWTAETLGDARQMAEDFASNMLALK